MTTAWLYGANVQSKAIDLLWGIKEFNDSIPFIYELTVRFFQRKVIEEQLTFWITSQEPTVEQRGDNAGTNAQPFLDSASMDPVLSCTLPVSGVL